MIIKRGQRPPPLSEDEALCRLLEPTKRTKHTICHFCCPNGKEIGEREREREGGREEGREGGRERDGK